MRGWRRYEWIGLHARDREGGRLAEVPSLDDPKYVEDEYADDTGLAGRIALWRNRTGLSPMMWRSISSASLLLARCSRSALAGASLPRR